jgi:hypothetical protein
VSKAIPKGAEASSTLRKQSAVRFYKTFSGGETGRGKSGWGMATIPLKFRHIV